MKPIVLNKDPYRPSDDTRLPPPYDIPGPSSCALCPLTPPGAGRHRRVGICHQAGQAAFRLIRHLLGPDFFHLWVVLTAGTDGPGPDQQPSGWGQERRRRAGLLRRVAGSAPPRPRGPGITAGVGHSTITGL